MSITRICTTLFSFILLPLYTTTGSPKARREQVRPETIPALKEWIGKDGEDYTFRPTSRILLDPTCKEQLSPTGSVFAADILMLTRYDIPVVSDGDLQEVRDGDIVLRIDASDGTLGAEGYRMDVTGHVSISASTAHGVFYGTRTLLQLLTRPVSCGSARDWPDHPERSLMVDMGRKYFSIPWLESQIRELAYLKYNYFHLHLSDTYGFRLESERHPEIVSPQYYSKEEIRKLIDLAEAYHITIVPEIDMPGHMDAILVPHPELQLKSSKGLIKIGDIDLAQDAAYRLMQDLLEEFLPLFPGPYWHIGADEYIRLEDYADFPSLLSYARQHYGPQADARDTYLGFVNWANELVKAHGKVTRAWSDGLHSGGMVQVATDIVYEHWLNDGLTPQEIVDRGILIMNGNADHLYYVPGRDWQAPADVIYELFEPHVFHDAVAVTQLHPKNLGAKLHVWCDYPDLESENQIAEGILYSLRALAQKNWGSEKLVPDYNSFVPIMVRIGQAPGYSILLPSYYLTPGQRLNVSIVEAENPSDEEDNEA